MLAGNNINLYKNCIEHMLIENLNAKKQISRWNLYILTPAWPQGPHSAGWLLSRETRSKPAKRPSHQYILSFSWLNTINNQNENIYNDNFTGVHYFKSRMDPLHWKWLREKCCQRKWCENWSLEYWGISWRYIAKANNNDNDLFLKANNNVLFFIFKL